MVTLVGTQTKFEDALHCLLELDYDAVEAYETAQNGLENSMYKRKLQEFQQDHERHIKEISDLLKKHGETPPETPSLKQWLTKGKVFLAELLGDSAILKAMQSNEVDTNTAYERICKHEGMWDDAREILERGLADEKKHFAWLQSTSDITDD